MLLERAWEMWSEGVSFDFRCEKHDMHPKFGSWYLHASKCTPSTHIQGWRHSDGFSPKFCVQVTRLFADQADFSDFGPLYSTPPFSSLTRLSCKPALFTPKYIYLSWISPALCVHDRALHISIAFKLNVFCLQWLQYLRTHGCVSSLGTSALTNDFRINSFFLNRLLCRRVRLCFRWFDLPCICTLQTKNPREKT